MNNSKKLFFIIISIVLVILLVVGILFFLNNKKEVNDQKDNTDIIKDKQEEQTDEKTNNDSTDEITSVWQNYNFTVNGKTLKLPLSYTELSSATGFTMNQDMTEGTLPKNYYLALNLFKNNSLALHTEIYNDTENTLKYSECKITRIWQTKYQIKNGADTITFPGNLTAGMNITKEQLFNILGETDKIKTTNLEGYNKETYKYIANENWPTTNYYEINVVNGVIDELILDKRFEW